MTNGSFHGHPDHDACGTGLIVHLGQPASHEVVDRGLVALQRLAHRGGVDADGASGDGAGLLTGIPQKFIRRCAEELGICLPRVFVMGMLFLPSDEVEQARIQRELERRAQDHGLKWLGWREVPVNHSVLGLRASETAPAIWQCFLAGGDCYGHGWLKRNPSLCIPVEFQAGAKAQFDADPSTALKGRSSTGAKDISIGFALDHFNGDYQSGQGRPDVDFEEKLEAELFLFRKGAETRLGSSVYFCSL